MGRMDKEVEQLLVWFFIQYAINGRVDYVTARKYLTPKELAHLKTLVTDLDWATDRYTKQLEGLETRTKVSRIEYLQLFTTSYFENAITTSYEKMMEDLNESNLTLILLLNQVLGEVANEDDANKLAKQITYSKSQYGTINTQIENIRVSFYKEMGTFIPQAFARKLSEKQVYENMQAFIKRVQNRCRYIIYTMSNYQFNELIKYFMNDLGMTSYKYCAVLDDRTSEICKSLHGSQFKLTQANVGVNFPPMHPNCRSYIIPLKK